MTQRRIDSYFLRSSSRSNSIASTVIDVDSDASTDEEQLPAGALRSTSTASQQLPIEAFLGSPATRSSSAPVTVIRRAVARRRPVVPHARVRRAWSLTVEARRRTGLAVYARRRDFYHEMRRRFAQPADRSMCLYCGIREHSAIHHEDEFKRNRAVSLSLLATAVQLTPRSCISLSALSCCVLRRSAHLAT
jgi:hypothetical protein